ncbi:MAG: alpha/beta hydrolase [Lentisphaeria bacterium]|nr:alpha/beta hydrolase [Lentisphaeria bacterium]
MPIHLPLWDTMPRASSEDNFDPFIDVYPAPGKNAAGCVLICPGGGYGGRAAHEGEPIAQAYNDHGLTAAVVHYRVSPNRHPAPLLDVSRAIRLLRKNASQWKVCPDKIAVLGFSAGGHLAATSGVFYDSPDLKGHDELPFSNRPDALILCYPVITSEPPFAHQGSYKNLLGQDADTAARARMAPDQHVSADTPPTFLWHTAEDAGVPPENSMLFAMSLSRHKIPYELHVFPEGRHGLGLAPENAHTAQWHALSVKWLKHIQAFPSSSDE